MKWTEPLTKTARMMYKEAGIPEDDVLEIEKRVYDEFPVSKSEMDCPNTKREMGDVRKRTRKKLIAIEKEKRVVKIKDEHSGLEGSGS